jgi:paraquat-inducible protein A
MGSAAQSTNSHSTAARGFDSLVACHDCDLVYRLPIVVPGQVARCRRCGAVIVRRTVSPIERPLALTVTALVLFVIANSFSFLALRSETHYRATTLLTGVWELYIQGFWAVAGLVFVTTFLVPLLFIVMLLYILAPMSLGWHAPGTAAMIRMIQHMKPWNMVEVFLLGILVSMVKIAKTATIIPGVSIYAFLLLVFVLAAVNFIFNPGQIWSRLALK